MITGSKRSFFALCIGEGINKLSRFFALVLFAHALTVEEFGVLNVVIAVTGMAVIASSLGLPDVASRDVAVDPASAGVLATRVISTRIAVLGLLLLATCVASVALAEESHVGLFLLGGVMGLLMASSADWIARGLSEMVVVASATATGGLVVLALAILLRPGGTTIEMSVVAYASGEAAAVAASWLAIRHRLRLRFDPSGTRELLRRAAPVAVAAVLVYVYYANLDVVLVSALRSSEEAGLYGAGYRLFLTLNLIPVFAAYAVFPAIARDAYIGDAESTQRRVAELLQALTLYGVVVIASIQLVGNWLINALYGNDFADGGTAFRVLSVAAAWYAIGYPVGYTLIARGKNRWFLEGAAVAGGLNLACNLILIPLIGITGASLATVVAFFGAAVVWLARGGPGGGILKFPVVAVGVATVAAFAATAEIAEPAAIAVLALTVCWAAYSVGSHARSLRVRA